MSRIPSRGRCDSLIGRTVAAVAPCWFIANAQARPVSAASGSFLRDARRALVRSPCAPHAITSWQRPAPPGCNFCVLSGFAGLHTCTAMQLYSLPVFPGPCSLKLSRAAD